MRLLRLTLLTLLTGLTVAGGADLLLPRWTAGRPRRVQSPKGAEAVASLRRVTTRTARVRIAPFYCPTNIVATNYWYDLEGSTDLVHWVVDQKRVGPGDVTVEATNRWRFFRLHGYQ